MRVGFYWRKTKFRSAANEYKDYNSVSRRLYSGDTQGIKNILYFANMPQEVKPKPHKI